MRGCNGPSPNEANEGRDRYAVSFLRGTEWTAPTAASGVQVSSCRSWRKQKVGGERQSLVVGVRGAREGGGELTMLTGGGRGISMYVGEWMAGLLWSIRAGRAKSSGRLPLAGGTMGGVC